MSTRADMSATLQDPDSRSVRPARNMSIAIIGPHIGRRGVVAKAVSSAEGRTVREFATYPDKVTELPRLLAQNFDVVMIDLDSDQNYALQLVQEVAATGTANVIVYSQRNDPTLGMISTHAGATDFLPIPADSPGEEGLNPPPVPERPAAVARPVEMRTPTRVPESAFAKEGNGQVRPQPVAAPRPVIQPSNPVPQVPSPVRPVISAGVKAPEVAPRPVAAPEPVQRVMTEPRPVPQSPAATRPAVVPEHVQRTIAEPRPIAPQAPAPRPSVQVPIQQSPVQPAAPRPPQNFVPAPVAPAPPPVPKPVASAAPTIPTVAPTPAPEPKPESAPEVAPAAQSGIQSDADILELFKYGKGQAQAKDFKDPDELPPTNSKKWVFISLGAVVVIAAVIVAVLLRPQHAKTQAAPAAPQVESGSLSTQATSASSALTPAPTSAVTAPETPIAKPSPTVPLVVDQSEQANNHPAAPISSEMMDAQLSAQSKISRDIKRVSAAEEAPPSSGLAPVSMDSGGGVKDATLGGFGKVNVVPVVSQVSAGVAEGMAIHKTPPVYPKIAKDSRVSGTVVLAATINRSGLLENVRVISGSQMLRVAAVEAVKTWRYRPYMLNNQPVAVQTTINVVFSLGKE